jgi:type I restriction-modification system DNA methylase subunit
MAKRVGTQSDQPFIKSFNKLAYRFSPWEVWKDFVVMFACALSNPVDKLHYDEREALYMKTIQKYNKEERELFPQLVAETVLALEENPEQDFLGNIFMNLGLGNKSGGQFFTPYHVCELMAKVTIGGMLPQIEKDGYISVCDPCCGAGATLIAGIHEIRKQLKGKYNYQNHVLVVGQDIDYTTALMCYIQLSLLGVAAYIKIGNTLTEPICSNDTLENYWFTPMYFSDVWTLRRIFRGKELL